MNTVIDSKNQGPLERSRGYFFASSVYESSFYFSKPHGAERIVMKLLISEGFKADRFHRKYILHSDVTNFGCVIGPHPKKDFMIVADYTRMFDELVSPDEQERKINKFYQSELLPSFSEEMIATWKRLGPLKTSEVKEKSFEAPLFNKEMTIGRDQFSNLMIFGQVALRDKDYRRSPVCFVRIIEFGEQRLYEGQAK